MSDLRKLLASLLDGDGFVKSVKCIIVAPGLPFDNGKFIDVEPTSVITEGVLKQVSLELLMLHGKRLGITLSPRDYLNLCDCRKFAHLMIDNSFDDEQYSKAVIVCPPCPMGIAIRGLSLASKKHQEYRLTA